VGRSLTLLDRDVRLDEIKWRPPRRVRDPDGHRKRNADAAKLEEAVIGRREDERRAGRGRSSSQVEDRHRNEEHDSQEDGEAADPGEEPSAQELLEVDVAPCGPLPRSRRRCRFGPSGGHARHDRSGGRRRP